MPVNTTHPQYDSAKERWRTVSDAAAGQEAVKKGTTRYLPDFIPPDKAKYEQYLKLAYYVNVTGRTRNGLIGATFRKEPAVDIPAQLEYMQINADGNGNSLSQLAKAAESDLLTKGRYGFLADYPSTEAGLSQEQVQQLGLKAYIKPYTAESIINWSTKMAAGQEILDLVVLQENILKQIDEFESKPEKQYRVLRLTNEMVYQQEVYDEKLMLVDNGIIIPRKSDGSAWDRIPFQFAGSDDNTSNVGISPLFDLANINLAHYRNVADVESSLRTFSQVMLHVDIGETSQEQWEKNNPNGVIFGASNGIVTQKGRVDIIQANPHSFGTEAIKDKEAQMVSVGARLISKSGVNQTAEEARINASSESSVLETVVDNLSEAITNALKFAAEFMGANPDDVGFELNREFFDSKLDAQEIMALIQLADRGDIAQSDIRSALRKSGQLPEGRTDDMIDEEVSQV